MLHQVLIRNFQKHKRRSLEFGKRITTITGRSDVGKSAIIRALRFVFLNQANSSDVRHGQKRMRVKAIFAEGTITRERKGTANSYTLDEQGYQAFGRTIPEPIADVLQLSSDNFQQQHDAPFWIGLGRPALAREINRVVDLEVIDYSLKEAAKYVRISKTRSELYEERVASALSAVKELQHVTAMRKGFDDLKSEETDIRNRKLDIEFLQELMEQESQLSLVVREFKEKQKHIKEIRKLAEAATTTKQKRVRLCELLSAENSLASHIKNQSQQQNKLKKELFSKGVCPLCKKNTTS